MRPNLGREGRDPEELGQTFTNFFFKASLMQHNVIKVDKYLLVFYDELDAEVQLAS